jgi:hypothetical protein
MAAGTRIMTGLAIAAAATLLVTVIWLAEPDPPVVSPPPDVVRVGLLEGQSVRGYLDSSHDELAELNRSGRVADTWALVTLGAYVRPDRLPPILTGIAVAQVYARAPLADAPTPVVRIPAYRIPQDVLDGMRATAVLRDQERADYLQLLRRVNGDTPSDSRLRQAYATAAQVAAAEAVAYRSGCACVFAAVVRASPAALTGLAGRPGVRAVDPAPEVGTLNGVEFDPPLPEQRVEPEPAGSGPPSSPPVAPATATPVPSSLGARDMSAPPDTPRGVVSTRDSGPSAPRHRRNTLPNRLHPARPRRTAFPGVSFSSACGGESSTSGR